LRGSGKTQENSRTRQHYPFHARSPLNLRKVARESTRRSMHVGMICGRCHRESTGSEALSSVNSPF
jgi:hypothetical protein